jgi:hypothetical protein
MKALGLAVGLTLPLGAALAGPSFPSGRMTGSMGAVAATFSQGDGTRDSGRWPTLPAVDKLDEEPNLLLQDYSSRQPHKLAPQ